jgi:hypothetical protein
MHLHFLIVIDPWEHVLGMGLGAVFVNQLVKFDEKLKEDLDKMLERAKQANERRYFGLCLLPLTFWPLNSCVLHACYTDASSAHFDIPFYLGNFTRRVT